MGRRLGKSECMIVDALWQVCTHKNYRVLFITPYENQVELIFRRIREIVNDSPMIKEEISRIKNSPYTVEFNNGSVILGFTTGAASGSGAASVRGQRADWLFLVMHLNDADDQEHSFIYAYWSSWNILFNVL